MPSLSPYRSELTYAYAPGFFPAVECLKHRPEQARRVLLHSKAAGSEGAEKLTALAAQLHVRVEEADKALGRISGKENCFAAAVFEKFSDELSAERTHVVLHHPSDCGNVGTILRTALGFGVEDVCFAAAVFEKFSDELSAERTHVVLHHPSDCGNVGTILRTALGFGVEDVALIRPCVDVFDPRVVRASMGSIFSLRIHAYDCFEQYRAEFAEHQLYPFMLDGSSSLPDVLAGEVPERCTLIFGNEGSGLPAAFAAMGQPVRIPSNDRVDSLNLSIAAAIAIYEFTQRKGGA